MRLNNLHDRSNKLRLLYEDDTGQPLESTRYPAIIRHVLAKSSPILNVEEEADALVNMAFEYSKDQDPENYEEAVKALRRSQAAFKRFLNRMSLNPMSGLAGLSEYDKMAAKVKAANAKKRKFGKPGAGEYIVVAADVDDMKFLNNKTGLGHGGVNSIIQNIGKMFKDVFNMKDTYVFHPHGDEFRVISKIGDDQEEARLRFAQLLRACLEVSNNLSSTGFYLDGWPKEQRVQPTISFGISNTDNSADGLLTHVKTGASGGKPMKFIIVNDRDLRYDLGFSPEEMNKYVQNVQPSNGDNVVSLDSQDTVYEAKMPMDDHRERRGPVILECSWSENTRKDELNSIRRQKRDYLDNPMGVMKVGKNYIPLREAFKSSR